ncbi:DUF456 domain-containing protein [Merismopedia glauca]|uniref:DUF456 domain-containing protein n=1 Tax=Merismopedia glauca CCAP 1448/3 TaxID=1296344 RepID=A0A2T1C0V5_9CYAN|nr:DUF456 family protein [Merismopedia glauca]PSB01797.1 DUF456 domain-containing protein [Merismopedia glauca CCAP 1448/3]
MSETLLYWVLVAIMVVGVLGAILPGIPGSSLIVIAVIIWGAIHGFSTLTWALGVSIVVWLLSIGIDFLAGYWGAKRFGASSWGQWGAFIGLFVGIFGLLPALPIGGPILGIFVGPFVGAILGEFLYRRELELTPRLRQAVQAGIGIVVGSLIGRLIHALLAIAAVVVFLWTTLPSMTGT